MAESVDPHPKEERAGTSAESALARAIEALLLAAEHPLGVPELRRLFDAAVDEEEWPAPVTNEQICDALRCIGQRLSATEHGIELVEVADGWRLRTRADLACIVRRLWPSRAGRLSKAALECLAIVAYRQPCTRIDAEEIRGVDCGGVLRSLLERKLVRITGRKDEPGRPLLYSTTPLFLETFSLPNLGALPTLRDLESMRAEEEARRLGRQPPPPAP